MRVLTQEYVFCCAFTTDPCHRDEDYNETDTRARKPKEKSQEERLAAVVTGDATASCDAIIVAYHDGETSRDGDELTHPSAGTGGDDDEM